MTDIEQQERIEVFVGVDVGKGAHHAVALDLTGKRLLDSALPNDEAKLRALISKLKDHGRVLLVVDQPARSAHFRLLWRELKVSQWPTCRGLRCVVSLTCMQVKPRRMRAMHISSRKPLAACRRRCVP